MAVRTETISLNKQSTGPQTQASIVFRQLRRNPSALIGGTVVAILIFTALAAPLIATHDPLQQNFREPLASPSSRHFFGTDDVGRDLFSRVVFGTRISLRVGLVAVAIGGSLGVLFGVLAGFYSGFVDNLVMRLMDVLLAFPGLLLALAIVAVLGPGLFNVMIAVGIGNVPVFTRMARASTMSVRERDYVLAARSTGCTDIRVMLRYVLPNAIAPVIVLATLGVAGAILTAASLSFIGVGAQPPTPEWGAILTLARQYLQRAWWFTFFPGLAIMITVLAINMLGDGLRDALDPRLRT